MKKGMGIRIRSSITAIFFMGILTASIAFIGCDLYRDSIMDRYITYADTVLTYAYRATVKYSFGDMIAARDMPAEYEVLRSELNAVKDGADIEYLYAIYFEDIDPQPALCHQCQNTGRIIHRQASFGDIQLYGQAL